MTDAGSSLRQALGEIAQLLQKAGIERARAEARLLAAHALGLSIEQIVADDGRLIGSTELGRLRALATERARRRPMSQILGYREFYGRRFDVTPDVLTPRPDSETLIDAVLDHMADRGAPLEVLELGVGTGCLLLTLLAELPRARGAGVDLSAKALEVARGNAAALGLAGRCRLVQGDWTNAITGMFDIVINNPPYIPSADIAGLEPEVATHEPRLALDGGADGLSFYRRLAGDIARLLRPQGLLALEVGEGQARPVAALLTAAGIEVLEQRRDLAGIERCVLGRKT